jgi:hypothetical protein
LPFSKRAPARTRATRWGALTVPRPGRRGMPCQGCGAEIALRECVAVSAHRARRFHRSGRTPQCPRRISGFSGHEVLQPLPGAAEVPIRAQALERGDHPQSGGRLHHRARQLPRPPRPAGLSPRPVTPVDGALYYTAPTDGLADVPLRTTQFQVRPGSGDKTDWKIKTQHVVNDWVPLAVRRRLPKPKEQ